MFKYLFMCQRHGFECLHICLCVKDTGLNVYLKGVCVKDTVLGQGLVKFECLFKGVCVKDTVLGQGPREI
jgi:hypothetical protein